MSIRVLMLATDAHGGFGGISQYNRDVIEAMSGLERISGIVVAPRIVETRDFIAPPKTTYDFGGLGGIGAFVKRSAALALRGGRFDLVYCAHINLAPAAAMAARICGAPMMLAIYGIDAWTRPSDPVTRWAARSAHLVVSISQITLDRFLAWSGAAPRASAVLPNAIRLADYADGPRDPRLEERLNVRGHKTVMTLGRMSADERYKGFDAILDVLPRLRQLRPDIAYLAVGDGTDRPRLQEKARALGVADVTRFTGRISEAEKADHYRLADLFAMPSNGEGFGFVVLEALACGTPVVASIADGTREAVLDGALGAMVDPRDPNAIQREIIAGLERPRAVPERLAYFSFPNFQERLRNALSTVVKI